MSVADSPMVMTLPGSRKAMVRVISSSDRTPTEWTAMPGGLFLWLQKTQPESQRDVIGRMLASTAESKMRRSMSPGSGLMAKSLLYRG